MTSPVAECAPCQHRARQFAAEVGPALPPPAPPAAGGTRWTGPLVYENQVTGEMPRRVFRPNSLYWSEEVLPLSQVRSAGEGHDGSIVVGKIEGLSRASDGGIVGIGDFDGASPDGVEAARLVGEDRFNWASVVIDDVELEVWVAKALLEEAPDILLAAAGDPLPAQSGYEVVATLSPDDEIHVVNKARIRGATLVETNAISNAKITLDLATPAGPGGSSFAGMMPDGQTPCSCDEADTDYDPDCVCEQMPTNMPPESVAAAGTSTALRPWAVQIDPPRRFFSSPRFERATPLTITDEGWFYGHMFAWGQCHIAYSEEGQCVLPPTSRSKYAYYHTGSVLTAEKSLLSSGRITLGTKHAGKYLSAAAALAHYEDTGLGAVDVRAGEDTFGGWVAGGLRPKITREQVRELRASPMSGDWRRIGGHLELVAVLAVNVAGFPIPRPEALVAGGQVQSLTAAGLVTPGMPLPREIVQTSWSTVAPASAGTHGIRLKLPALAPPPIDPAQLAARVKLSKFAVQQRHNGKVRV